MTSPSSPSNPTPTLLPEMEELQREQLVLANQKLKIETQNLERQSAPDKWWSKLGKNVIAFGGAVTVVATLYGIWDSYNKTIIDRQRTRTAEQRIRFEDAVKRLESSNTISKLVGVAVLSGYLDAENKDAHRQVLFTLAGLMATEKDVQARAAVIDLISAIPVPGPIAELDWFYFQDILVSQSRALVAKLDLLSRRNFATATAASTDEQTVQVIGKLISLNIRKGAAPGYTRYQGIYCVGCDLRGSAFPRGANFTGAILDNANFNGARLDAAIFDNAELSGVSFVEADLRQARFRSLEGASIGSVDRSGADGVVGRTSYLDHIVGSMDVNAAVTIRMPKFNCANLEGASFKGHALFPSVVSVQRKYSKADESKVGWYRTVPAFVKERATNSNEAVAFAAVRVFPPLFFKTNLKDVDLADTRFFTVGFQSDPADFMGSANAIRTGELVAWIGTVDPDVFKEERKAEADTKSKKKSEDERDPAVRREIDRAAQRLRAAFYMTAIDKTAFPTELGAYLKTAPASAGDYHNAFRTSVFANEDPDLRCTPRQG
jgi:uncharacterized protein YjbI with pentapeptide repeats